MNAGYRWRAGAVAGIATVGLALSSTSAVAVDQDPLDTVEQAVASATVALSPLATDGVTTESEALLVENGSGRVDTQIPEDPASGIVMPSSTGTPLTFDIPADSVALGTAEDGTVTYEADGDDAYLSVQALDDGSVRTLVTLVSADAPTSYAFPMDLPAGGYLNPLPDGSVELVGGLGQTLAIVAAPWAMDAAGEAVETAFSIQGTTLVQTVLPGDDAAYPIVADPWVQGDCGTITCTIRLDRASTRNARDASWLIAAAAGACAVLTAGTAAVICGAAIAPASIVMAVAAGRYYEAGNCLGIRFYPHPPVQASWPTEVKKNKYNCR